MDGSFDCPCPEKKGIVLSIDTITANHYIGRIGTNQFQESPETQQMEGKWTLSPVLKKE